MNNENILIFKNILIYLLSSLKWSVEGVGTSNVIIGAEVLFLEPSGNSWLCTVSWPSEHLKISFMQC